MKKSIISFLLVLSVVFTLFSCANTNQVATNVSETSVEVDEGVVDFDPSTIKTMGDFYKYKNEELYNYQEGYNESKYQVILEINHTYYRATVDLTNDLYDKIIATDFEKRDAVIRELIDPLPIVKFENLTDMIPSDEEINKYVGKTGKELFDEDWTYMYYNVEDMVAGLYHGAYLYDVAFSYDGPKMVNTEDFDFYKEFADLKVKSIKFSDIGNAIDID